MDGTSRRADPLRPAAPRARRWPRVLGWGLLAAALLVYGHVCVVRGGDFVAFYDQAEATRLLGDIHAKGPRSGMNVPYFPHYSLALVPLTLLPPYAAGWIWFVLKLGVLVFLVRWVQRTVRARAPGASARAAAVCVALPFLIAVNPLNGDFRLGQANLFVLFLVLLTVAALERRRALPAAFLFSLAIVKVTALALLPWLVLRRQWRFLAWLALVLAGWVGFLAAWWGPQRIPQLFAGWVRTTAANKASFQSVSFFENQSLQGALARLAGVFPALQRPLLGLALHQWLVLLACLAMLAVLLVATARDRFRPRLPPEELAFVSLLMLLASSDSRWAHHVQLLVPLAVLAALAARLGVLESLPGAVGRWFSPGAPAPGSPAPGTSPADVRERRTVTALLAAGLLVLVVGGRDLVGRDIEHALRIFSLHTAFDVALAGFLAVRLLRRPGAARPPPAEG